VPDGTGVPADAPPGTARVLRGERLEVSCGQGRLAILRLQLPGRRAMSAAEFLHGRGPGALVFA
jgi:methionyl-tRNA formyltransferase